MTTAALLPAGLELAEPDVAGPLTVFPLVAPDGALEYRSFAEASAHGFAVRELPQASVNDLLAVNPLDVGVLLYEGEEVVGAQQDRTFDVSVLVPAGARIEVPVSCVEEGRWEELRSSEPFTPSERSAYPALRAAKNRQARAAMAAGREPRADQIAVWREVADKGERVDASAPTGAMGGIYDGHAGRLDSLVASVTRRHGQVGTLACIAGRPAVLDLVSRADAFASLFGPLVRGYCLDAIEHEGTVLPGARPDAEAFVAAIGEAPGRARRGVGLGQTVAFAGSGVGGSALVVDGELVQLTAFAEDGSRGPRILRPSRRH